MSAQHRLVLIKLTIFTSILLAAGCSDPKHEPADKGSALQAEVVNNPPGQPELPPSLTKLSERVCAKQHLVAVELKTCEAAVLKNPDVLRMQDGSSIQEGLATMVALSERARSECAKNDGTDRNLEAFCNGSSAKREIIVSTDPAQHQDPGPEHRDGDHEQAKSDNRLANEAILATWKNLSPDVRAQLLESQRAWIAKKTSDCAIEASAVSEEMIRDAARLSCDTKATLSRMSALKEVRLAN